MPEKSERTTLEGLVCQNNMKEAIEQLKSLIEHLAKDPLNELIGLSGRYSANNKADDDGMVQREVSEIENNRIRTTFLRILSDVREEIQTKINFFKPIPRAANERDTLRDFIDTVLSRKYVNITPFSEGNSFIYFQAKERHSDQEVMIMVLKSSDIEDIKRSSQLKRISRLKHRNLIQLLDVNFQTYPYYMITEMVSGISLKSVMSTTGAFQLHNAIRLLLIIGDVMNYLRQKKFTHSGFRPSKILIDQELEPEISPFDILKVSEKKLLASTLLEDSYYFAPERLHGVKDNSNEATDKANQFCLAALAYQMITGEKLFKGSNLSQVLLSRHRFFNDREFRKEKLSHPKLPARVASVIKKMLEEKPSRRYDDLNSALSKLSKVKVVLDANEERVFQSYRRCLVHSDNFIEEVYKNLFAKPPKGKKQPAGEKGQNDKQSAEEQHKLLHQNFHLIVHLLFDTENAVSFMARIIRLAPGRANIVAEYTHFVEAFIKSVSECDPRWNYRSDVRQAWSILKERIINSLKNAVADVPFDVSTPEDEDAQIADPMEEEPDIAIQDVLPASEELKDDEEEDEDDMEDTESDDIPFDGEKA